MAFAAVDPKKAEYLRQIEEHRALMERTLHEAAQREIELIESRERAASAAWEAEINARRIRIQQETRKCYGEHTPAQIAQAGKMMAQVNAPAVVTLAIAEASNEVCWERIGRSYGGRRKANLYRCTARA